MYDKTMNFLIFGGNPNGLIMGELSNWNGRVYKIARNAISEFSTRPDAQHTGVYFLFGRDQDLNDTIYVGEAEKMLPRIKQHINAHEEWNECIVVISKDDHLNKAHVKHLEYNFYHLAQMAKRFELKNSNEPTCSSVSEYDKAMLMEFIDHTKLLVNTLGYKAFDILTPPVTPGKKASTLFYIKTAKGADAQGIIVPDGFAVLKGSKIAPTVTPSFPASSQKIRDRLLQNGVIDSSYTFTQDYYFTSPSTPAAIVMGRSANGRTEWKNQIGQSLSTIEAIEMHAL